MLDALRVDCSLYCWLSSADVREVSQLGLGSGLGVAFGLGLTLAARVTLCLVSFSLFAYSTTKQV